MLLIIIQQEAELFLDCCYRTGTNCTATFADREASTFFDRDWSDQLYSYCDVVAWHYHFSTFWQVDDTCYVSCTEIELWTISCEERFVTSTLFFSQDVNLSCELSVWLNGSRLGQYLSALDLSTVNTTQQCADVVTRLSGIQQFTEHFNARNDGFFSFFVDTNDFNLVADFNCTTLYAASSNCTTTSDGEYVLDWHQEWFFSVALWSWDVSIDFFEHLNDFFSPRTFWVLQSFTSGTASDWSVIAWELIFVQQVANFHFNQFKQLFVFNHVAFVQEYDDVRNAYLAGQQDVFASLWHWAVSCGYNQNRSVHLSRASDHVFNIVGVTWAVNVSVVTSVSFVLNVCCGDCDTAFALFWSFVDLIKSDRCATVSFGQYSSDCSSQSCFTMVNVTDSTNVNVWFITFEFSLCHLNVASL
ncbi:hypothetical protein PAECIP111890_06085 [Paenibacillus sp. JJ-223]|nr:hypothetical protein PAECIP111890_06085 [Paenibacillus sp. JJ-223]